MKLTMKRGRAAAYLFKRYTTGVRYISYLNNTQKKASCVLKFTVVGYVSLTLSWNDDAEFGKVDSIAVLSYNARTHTHKSSSLFECVKCI